MPVHIRMYTENSKSDAFEISIVAPFCRHTACAIRIADCVARHVKFGFALYSENVVGRFPRIAIKQTKTCPHGASTRTVGTGRFDAYISCTCRRAKPYHEFCKVRNARLTYLRSRRLNSNLEF